MPVNKKNTTQINWTEVDAVPESKYNYNDAPEVSAEMFGKMTILMPDDTKNINIRVKNSTIEFFKINSKHYQTMINAVLDAYVDAQKKQKVAH
jgi:uncharacterized protein (DUF4415 family)